MESVYRTYMTDGIRAICGGTAKRYIEMTKPNSGSSDQTAEEIIACVVERGGLTLIHEHESI